MRFARYRSTTGDSRKARDLPLKLVQAYAARSASDMRVSRGLKRLAVREEQHLAGQADYDSHHSGGLQRGDSLQPCASRQARCRSRIDVARSHASSGCSPPDLPKQRDCRFSISVQVLTGSSEFWDCLSSMVSAGICTSEVVLQKGLQLRKPRQAFERRRHVCACTGVSGGGVAPHRLEGGESMRRRPRARSTAL